MITVHTIAVIPHESPQAIDTLLQILVYSMLDSLFDSLLGSLVDSLFDRLLDSLLETVAFKRATCWRMKSLIEEAFSRWQTLSLWKLCLMDGSKSVEALLLTLMQPAYYLSASGSMITITDTVSIVIITIAIITIAIITIAIITIAIITINPRRNMHTYTKTWCVAVRRFSWTIRIGVLLSPTSNFPLLLWKQRLRLSMAPPWGVVQRHHGGSAKNTFQTIILTDVMIFATPTCRLPPATRCMAPVTQHISGSSFMKHT